MDDSHDVDMDGGTPDGMRITKILVDHNLKRNAYFDTMDELKKMEKIFDLEQESDKLEMKDIKMLRMEVLRSMVKIVDCYSFFSLRKVFEVMDELKKMEKMLDLEQESDKLMMEEIMMLKIVVLKNMVENRDWNSLSLLYSREKFSFDILDKLKKVEKTLDLKQESHKLMMKVITKFKIEVLKNLVKKRDWNNILSLPKAFDAMDELKKMEKMLDLEQESDKLMMEEIIMLKIEVLKNMVENLAIHLVDKHFYLTLIEGLRRFELGKMRKILDLEQKSHKLNMEEIKKLKMEVEKMNLQLERIVKCQLVLNMIFTTKQKFKGEKRKALSTKNSVYSKKGCSYSETCLSKKKTYSKLNCGYSDVFLSTDDNACSERVCNFSIQNSKGKRPLAPASYPRNGVVYKAKKRNSCTEQLQGWTGITVIYLKICLKVNYQIWIIFMATYLVILKILQLKTTLQPKRIHFLTDCQLSLKTSGLKRQIFQLKTTTQNQIC